MPCSECQPLSAEVAALKKQISHLKQLLLFAQNNLEFVGAAKATTTKALQRDDHDQGTNDHDQSENHQTLESNPKPSVPVVKTPNRWVVEDLQLPQATTVFTTDTLSRAVEIMKENDFSTLPVVNDSRRVVGLLSLQSIMNTNTPNLALPLSTPVLGLMSKFRKGSTYNILTLDTPLGRVEELLEGTESLFITDSVGKFPLAVVTRNDLDRFYASVHQRSGYGVLDLS